MKIYEMSDSGLLHHFLGIKIYQDDSGAFIAKRNMLKRF